MKNYDKIIKALTVEELCGQLLCYDLYDKDNEKTNAEILRRIHPGGIFIGSKMSEAKLKGYTALANGCTKVPVIVASDIVDGPGNIIDGECTFSSEMARGAADDEALAYEAGRLTAQISRKFGYHWTYGPIVDLSINKSSPITNVGAVSDDPDQVIKINKAVMLGMMENGLLMPTLKHFPGDGTDDRNPHFCTTINRLNKEDWLKTYGKIYKELIAAGAPAIMAAHVSLPAFEDVDDENDALPGTLSYNILTKLLKQELGFKGCIVSDAMSMIGATSRVGLDRLAVEFIKAGGDMILFPEPTDYKLLIKAVNDGEITQERLYDAVSRVFALKDKARLFESQRKVEEEIKIDREKCLNVADEISEKSIKFVRDRKNILPLKISKGAKLLMVNLSNPFFNKPPTGDEFLEMKNELLRRGYEVDYYDNIGHYKVKEIMNNYEVIFVNCNINPGNYHGGTLRIGWNNIMTFWRGYILQHPKMIFTSFGDPYKIYEFPYLDEYINAFNNTAETQRGFVRVVLGEKPMLAKNPVELKGFFKREV